ncbi:MAG: hypothetical protein LBR15_08600 [Methanobrevibacter sp.]|nr:hypothetical protein [Candidatus Methanovirga australis]
MYSMGVAGPTMALIFFNPLCFLLGLIGPLIMWSRVTLKKHTIPQVLAGSICGYILTFMQIYYLTKLMHFVIDIDMFLIIWTILGLSLPPLVLSLTGYLNSKGFHDGYTRKMFHFSAFASFFIFLNFSSLIPTIALVLSGTISISIACFGGLDFSWLKGMRRKSDFPNETFYIILPLIFSLLWIIIGFLLFNKEILLIGTACVAICDAIAEPVGVRFGKHKYNVKAIRGKPSQRSIERSLSIFVSAVIVVLLLTNNLFLSIILSILLTFIEAISPRGTDNITVPLSAAIIVSLWLIMIHNI